MADHLSRLHISGGKDIGETFPDEHLLAISSHAPWYAHIVNFIVTGSIPEHWNRHQKDKFFHELKYYFWEEPLLFHLGYDQIIRRCVPEEEQGDILGLRCVTHRRAEDTSRHERPQTRSYSAASTGPPSSRTPTVSTRSAYNVKRRSTSPSEMRCRCGRSLR